MQGAGWRVQGAGYRVQGLGFGFGGLVLRDSSFECRVHSARWRV